MTGNRRMAQPQVIMRLTLDEFLAERARADTLTATDIRPRPTTVFVQDSIEREIDYRLILIGLPLLSEDKRYLARQIQNLRTTVNIAALQLYRRIFFRAGRARANAFLRRYVSHITRPRSGLPATVTTKILDQTEAFEERAAIMEYDGGNHRGDAEAAAAAVLRDDRDA